MQQMVLKTKPNSWFDPNATYVVSGGLGGLGQNAVNWLVVRGARNLLLLSRSGGDSPEGREILDSLRARGVKVMAPACNVNDVQALRKSLDDCRQHMPPIKGCIQGAMVLRVSVLPQYSVERIVYANLAVGCYICGHVVHCLANGSQPEGAGIVESS
jgi:NAD(P)-dependent dehydrogenase (short-subunit alcohol dehydrogenase family)